MELFPYVDLKNGVANLVATKEDAANRGVADGYAALDSSGRVPLSQTHSDVTELIYTAQRTSEKDQAGGYAALDATRRIATNRLPANVATVAADWPTYKPRIPPAGGGGDMVLTKSSSTDYAYTWKLPPGAQDLSALQSDVTELEGTVASLPLSSVFPWSVGTAPATAVRKHLNSIWWTPEATTVEPGYDNPFPLHTDVAGWTTSGCLPDRSEGIVSDGNAVAVSTTGIPIAQLDGFSVSFQIKGTKSNGYTGLSIAYDNAIGDTHEARGVGIWSPEISTTVWTPVRLECTYEGSTLTLRLYVNDILRSTETGSFVATHFHLRFFRFFNGWWHVKGPFTGQGAPKAPWLKVVDMDEYRKLPWALITGKPTAYPPATHTHAWADVTGKPSTFAPSAHTHTKSQITDLGPQLPTTGLTVGDTLTWNGTTWVGGPGAGVPTTGNQTGDLLRWNGSVWIQTTTKFHEGTGNPNGVVTAPVGSTFVNTESGGYNGARRWTKATGSGNTGWVVVDGDTGWRDITTYMSNLDPANAGTVKVKRVGKQVTYAFNNVLLASGTGSLLIYNGVPAGYRPASESNGFAFGYLSRHDNINILQLVFCNTSVIQWRVEQNMNPPISTTIARPTSGISGQFTIHTIDDWPTALW